VEGPQGTISYTYDALNRVTSVSYPQSRVISYAYDGVSNRTKLTYPDSTYITYSYDELNRLTDIKNGSNQVIAHYNYDALSRRTDVSYINGTNAGYTYDNISRLTALTNTLTDKTLADSYTYDTVGNRRTHSSMRTASPRKKAIPTTIYIRQVRRYYDNLGFPDTTYNYRRLRQPPLNCKRPGHDHHMCLIS